MNIRKVLPSTEVLCCVLLWIAESSLGIPDHLNSSLANRQETICDYMERDDTQKNAYTHGSGFCCFCPRGKYFVDDCDPSNPLSTRCKRCLPGTHIHYGPHLQTECFRKYRRHCASPKVYFEGDEEIADGCVCPNGMYEDKVTGKCRSISDMNPPTTPTIKSTEKTITTSKTTTTMKSNSPTTTDVGRRQAATFQAFAQTTKPLSKKMVTVTGTTTSTGPGTGYVDGIVAVPLTKATPDHANTALIVGVSVAVAAVLIVVFLLRSKLKRIYETTMRQQSNMSSNSKYEVASEDSSTSSSAVSVLLATDRSNHDNPIRQTAGSVQEDAPLLNDHAHPVMSPNAAYIVNEISNNDETNNTEEAIRKSASKILSEYYETFALQAANKLKTKMNRKDVLPYFRRVTGIDQEVTLQDLSSKHQHDTAELVYECMKFAIALNGLQLSPLYIWQQFKALGYQGYTEVVSDEIHRFVTARNEDQSNQA